MCRLSRLWLPSLVVLALSALGGVPWAAPAAHWGCLYEGEGGVYWLSATPGAVPVQVLRLEGADNSVDDFAISPNGQRLAIISGGWTCEIIELATGVRTPVWAADRDPGPLAWSPDGNALAYVQGGVLSVLPVGGTARVLVADKRVSDMSWSPDGKRIAYGRRDENDQDLGLFVIPAAGGQPKQLVRGTHDIYGVADISWSPDGRRLAFMHAWEGGALCFVNADGTGYRANIGAAFGPAKWLRDGSAVVYTAMENEVETLGVYRCGSLGRPEAIISGKNVTFDMLPSGRLLVINSPGERSKHPTYLKLLPTPRATARPLWQGTIAAAAISSFFEPDGSRLALWVQDKQRNESLWIGAVGQSPTRRVGNIKRLLGWSQGPGGAG
ncbi:hypothetical protein LLH23_17245 [bacterium]|nr:hypothetical protein [bacterium]